MKRILGIILMLMALVPNTAFAEASYKQLQCAEENMQPALYTMADGQYEVFFVKSFLQQNSSGSNRLLELKNVYYYTENNEFKTANSSGSQTINGVEYKKYIFKPGTRLEKAAYWYNTGSGGGGVPATYQYDWPQNSAPVIRSIIKRPNATWAKEPVTVEILASDVDNDVLYYSFNGGAGWQLDAQKAFYASSSADIRVRDEVGNMTSGGIISWQIDMEHPATPEYMIIRR